MSWSNFIRDDLRARIGRDDAIPEKLTLHGLSEQYGVSITPVRNAVDELIAEKYLVRHENGRLTVNPRKLGRLSSQDSSNFPQPPRDYREEISRDLILKSLSGPVGFIREEQTAEQYGISTAAVREVFHRLAGQGVLRHLPRRGWELRPFRRQDFEDYLNVREVLELVALEQAWPRLEDRILKQIAEGNRLPILPRERPVIDDSLHEYLVELADNHYIRDFFQRHGKYFAIVFAWDAEDRNSAMETVQQHQEILAAILKRDLPAARTALSNHIRTNYALLKHFPRRSSDGP